MILQSILLFHTSWLCKFLQIFFTLIQIHKLSLIQLYMYNYMKAQFQIFQHDLIK